MRRQQLRPYTGTGDTMGLAVCLALLAHALLIFGISFANDDKVTEYDNLDVMLVQKSSEKAPEKADFLAQRNLEGGGDSDESERPATPFMSPNPEQAPNLVTPSAKSTPSPDTDAQLTEQTLAADTRESENQKDDEDEKDEKVKADELLAAEVDESNNPLTTPDAKQSPEGDKGKDVKETASPPQPKSPSATELMSRSMEMASLSAEIERRLEAKAKRPNRKFISASTREYKYAAYMESWRAKVERIGNINYPDIARREKLSGTLILDVAINPDGSINEIIVKKPSGFKVLDNAAINIVRLASPFAIFPENIRDEVDILHITRTWKFLHNQKFTGK